MKSVKVFVCDMPHDSSVVVQEKLALLHLHTLLQAGMAFAKAN
jgi:hypothetical protein